MRTRIIIPMLPPSTNSIYSITRNGRLYLSKRHREFKKEVTEFLSKENVEITHKKLKVAISFTGCRTNSDIDNMLKALLDSMNGIIYKDDKQIYQLIVTKSNEGDKETSVIISDHSE